MWSVILLAALIAIFFIYQKWARAKTEKERKRYEAEQSYHFDEANVTGFHKKLERLVK